MQRCTASIAALESSSLCLSKSTNKSCKYLKNIINKSTFMSCYYIILIFLYTTHICTFANTRDIGGDLCLRKIKGN